MLHLKGNMHSFETHIQYLQRMTTNKVKKEDSKVKINKIVSCIQVIFIIKENKENAIILQMKKDKIQNKNKLPGK